MQWVVVSMTRPWTLAFGALTFTTTALVLTALGAPTPSLFAGLVSGAAVASTSTMQLSLPQSGRRCVMAAVGVAAGARIDADVLHYLATRPAAVCTGVVATLSITMLCGQLLRLRSGVSAVTASFASIGGGASGVSVIAREQGADDAVVLSVQYLRVVLVLISVPLVAPLLGVAGGTDLPAAEPVSPVNSLLFTAIAWSSGLGLAVGLRFSAAPIVLPLITSCALSISGVFPGGSVPDAVIVAAFACVGLDVGLSMTRPRLGQIARILPLAMIQAAAGMLGCAIIGVLLADALGIPRIDGYLATTPGGLPAVIAVAIDSGQELGLILAMQFVRFFLALLVAPLLGWTMSRRSNG